MDDHGVLNAGKNSVRSISIPRLVKGLAIGLRMIVSVVRLMLVINERITALAVTIAIVSLGRLSTASASSFSATVFSAFSASAFAFLASAFAFLASAFAFSGFSSAAT